MTIWTQCSCTSPDFIEHSHSEASTINSLLDVTNNDQITEDTTMVRVTKAKSKVMRKLISQSNKGMNKVTPHVSSIFTLLFTFPWNLQPDWSIILTTVLEVWRSCGGTLFQHILSDRELHGLPHWSYTANLISNPLSTQKKGWSKGARSTLWGGQEGEFPSHSAHSSESSPFTEEQCGAMFYHVAGWSFSSLDMSHTEQWSFWSVWR